MILVKLGGSIITNKEKPLSPRKKNIDNIAKNLKKIHGIQPLVIVHGGGSFGHYWSVKYDMHTKPHKYNIHGVSVVKNSMVELDKIILDSFLKNKLDPYCLPPTDFVKGDKPIPYKIKEISKIARSGLTPITYGDALWYGKQNKSYILSGDRIMTMLAKILRPKLCIFVLDVDGLYSDLKTKKLVKRLSPQTAKFQIVENNRMDVTGGMRRKIQEATKISKMNIDVFFVNGKKPQRIINAIKKKEFEGTMFRGK